MQYDAVFFTLPAPILCRLWRLGYCWKCHILEPQSQQLPILYCGATPMGNPKCRWKLGKSLNLREKQGSFLNPGVPRYPPFLPTPNFQLLFVTLNIWNWFLSERMLLDPSLRPQGGTRIWTQNSKYRMRKKQLQKPFFPPGLPINPPSWA